MSPEKIKYSLRSNLWYTFDGRLLRGLADVRFGKEVRQQTLIPFDIPMLGGLITSRHTCTCLVIRA